MYKKRRHYNKLAALPPHSPHQHTHKQKSQPPWTCPISSDSESQAGSGLVSSWKKWSIKLLIKIAQEIRNPLGKNLTCTISTENRDNGIFLKDKIYGLNLEERRQKPSKALCWQLDNGKTWLETKAVSVRCCGTERDWVHQWSSRACDTPCTPLCLFSQAYFTFNFTHTHTPHTEN